MIEVDKKSMPKAHGLIRAEKLRNPGTRGARPVTIEMLDIWIKHMQHDDEYNSYDKNIWTAAWVRAFFGKKRISEYTYNPDVLVNLTISDLQFEYHPENEKFMRSSYCILNRRKGKTNQFGADLYAVFLCTCNLNVCALCTLKTLIQNRKKSVSYEKIENQMIYCNLAMEKP